MEQERPIDACILAVPETAGSALYGMIDVLAATGTLWRELVGDGAGHSLIKPRIVSLSRDQFRCGNGIPVCPDVSIDAVSRPDIVVVPELWLAPTDAMEDRYPTLKDWLRQCYANGSTTTPPVPARCCWLRPGS